LKDTTVVVANTMLMYKKRKLRSHFLSHLYAVMHDARPSLFYLCGLVCGLAVLRSGFRDTAKIPQNMSVAAAVICPILGLLSTYMPNQQINMAQTETHSKILPSPYIGLYCCCFFLERLFIRGSNTEYDHTVNQHTVSSRSVSSS